MKAMNKLGGVSALIASATVILGIDMFATLVSDHATGDLDPDASVAFLAVR